MDLNIYGVVNHKLNPAYNFFLHNFDYLILSDEITIIGLGPLTNLASCINADPNFSSRVKELMLMGGNSHGEGNITMCGEFNFHADPEAAKVVIDRMQCPICIVPWETCKSTNISWASLTNLFSFDSTIYNHYQSSI